MSVATNAPLDIWVHESINLGVSAGGRKSPEQMLRSVYNRFQQALYEQGIELSKIQEQRREFERVIEQTADLGLVEITPELEAEYARRGQDGHRDLNRLRRAANVRMNLQALDEQEAQIKARHEAALESILQDASPAKVPYTNDEREIMRLLELSALRPDQRIVTYDRRAMTVLTVDAEETALPRAPIGASDPASIKAAREIQRLRSAERSEHQALESMIQTLAHRWSNVAGRQLDEDAAHRAMAQQALIRAQILGITLAATQTEQLRIIAGLDDPEAYVARRTAEFLEQKRRGLEARLIPELRDHASASSFEQILEKLRESPIEPDSELQRGDDVDQLLAEFERDEEDDSDDSDEL